MNKEFQKIHNYLITKRWELIIRTWGGTGYLKHFVLEDEDIVLVTETSVGLWVGHWWYTLLLTSCFRLTHNCELSSWITNFSILSLILPRRNCRKTFVMIIYGILILEYYCYSVRILLTFAITISPWKSCTHSKIGDNLLYRIAYIRNATMRKFLKSLSRTPLLSGDSVDFHWTAKMCQVWADPYDIVEQQNCTKLKTSAAGPDKCDVRNEQHADKAESGKLLWKCHCL